MMKHKILSAASFLFFTMFVCGQPPTKNLIAYYPLDCLKFVSSAENMRINIQVLDILGRKITEQNLAVSQGVNNLSVDVSGFYNGQYNIEVTASNGKYRTQKQILVKHL